MKKIILLICLIFLFFMADPYWQNLLKSYTDSEKIEAAILRLIAASGGASGAGTWAGLNRTSNDTETIEQAIARLIAVHEADPNSHLGVGESMQNHKSADVIDHPALSIVPDKFSNAETFLNLNTYPTETGEAVNCTIYGGILFLHVLQSGSQSGAGSVVFSSLDVYDLGYNNGDILFDFMIFATGASGTWDGIFDFSWGQIELKQGNYRIGYNNGSQHWTGWTSVSVANPLRFRFFYDSANSMLYVNLRDTQIFSVSFTPAFVDNFTMYMYFAVNRGTSSSMDLRFGAVRLWMDGF